MPTTPVFTQEQLDALRDAISQGVELVKYADKEVKYRSLEEMIRLEAIMEAKINGTDTNRAHVADYHWR